jgi:hypothetical protein
MPYIPRILTVLSLGVAALGVACSGTANTNEASFGDGGSGGVNGQSGGGAGKEGGAGASCVACLTDGDCGGGVCAQFGGDTYCASSCSGGTTCASSDACTVLASANGNQVSVCVPRSGCGAGSGSSGGTSSGGSSGSGSGSSGGSSTSSSSSGGGTCGSLVPPGTASTCSSCSSSSSSCQPNGCYGGWYCNSQTSKCQAPPTSGCGGSSSGSGSGSSGSGSSSGTGSSSGGGINQGPAPTGSVGPTGGTVSRLYFAVVGDTRPANVDDTSGYPTSVITKIFQDMQGMSPPPTFGVSTGDYMFATPGKGNASPQLDLYVTARGNYSNTMFPAMGNHECTGYTASNCGSGNSDGITENYTAFLTQMLQPLGQTNPYYAININGTGWTSKFVFVAANAWTSAQSSWLSSTLAQPTTYTFILRHESASANTAPGVSPAEQIMSGYPYTLSIVGHTHTYQKSGSKEVIFGNGGAPLSGGNYGFGLIQQRASDNAIQVDMIDYSTMQPDTSFEFAVNADGSAAPK